MSTQNFSTAVEKMIAVVFVRVNMSFRKQNKDN